jgi:hypothetical protein
MLRLRVHPRLRALQGPLKQALERVPVRARGFHGRADALRAELDAELQRFFPPWIEDLQFHRLHDGAGELVRLAEALEPLLRAADALGEEVRQFEGRVPSQGDGHAAQRQRRCRAWLAEIEHAPAAVTREAHLSDAHRQLEAVRAALHLHAESEHWLAEAERLLGVLRDDPSTAPLAADLPELWQHLFSAGAKRAWIDELRRRLVPLKELAERREAPPPQIHDAEGLMSEIERWTRALETGGGDIEELRRQHDLVVREWHQRPAAELDALVSAAEALRRRLIEQARQERAQLLDGLETDLVDVLRACGEDARLHAMVDDLKRRSVERPEKHRDWKARQRETRDHLRAVAKTHEHKLEQRLNERVANLGERLAVLRTKPLSEDGLRQIKLLTFELEQVRGLTDADDILRGLGQAARIATQLEQLEERDASEARALVERAGAQAAQAERLRTALRLAGLEGAVSLAELDVLLDPAEQPPTLTAARARQDRVEELLTRLENDCVMRCAELAQQARAQAVSVRKALQDAGLKPPPAGGAPAAAEEPESAAQELLAARSALAAAQAAIEAALLELEEQQQEHEQRLADLSAEDLSPAEAAEAEHLREENARRQWTGSDDPPERLRQLSTLLLRTRSFLTRLDRGRQAVLTRAAALRQRLKRFDEDHFRVYCPELAERAAGLIYGVPDDPAHWPAAQAQLEQAQTLLGRLERHAQRLAMTDAQAAADALRRAVRHATDAAQREADEALLQEWEQCEAERFAPLMLRLRLIERATLGAGGGVA